MNESGDNGLTLGANHLAGLLSMPTLSTFGLRQQVAVCALALAAVLPHVARAALGQPESAVSTDVQQLRATVKSTQRTTYRLHEIQLPTGSVLREFAVPSGNVFAVAWSGPSIPNLRQALGVYFDTFVNAARTPHSGHTHLEIRQTGFVMQSGGHMRAFSGRAYLPQAIPVGTALDEIR
jgi:hypothetical protein